MFVRALVRHGVKGTPGAVLRRCNVIITVNVPEEKTWIPD
jgi:MoxR-like ATPase